MIAVLTGDYGGNAGRAGFEVGVGEDQIEAVVELRHDFGLGALAVEPGVGDVEGVGCAVYRVVVDLHGVGGGD